MNVEEVFSNKKFMSTQLKSIPKYFRGQLSSDEIKSDLALAVCNCAKNFNNAKYKNISAYVRKSFINNLQNSLKDKQFFKESEAPLEAAYNHTYEDEPFDRLELKAYLSTLPTNLLYDITEFVLGKKNKEEIVSNPSFKKINIDRILDKLDCLI